MLKLLVVLAVTFTLDLARAGEEEEACTAALADSAAFVPTRAHLEKLDGRIRAAFAKGEIFTDSSRKSPMRLYVVPHERTHHVLDVLAELPIGNDVTSVSEIYDHRLNLISLAVVDNYRVPTIYVIVVPKNLEEPNLVLTGMGARPWHMSMKNLKAVAPELFSSAGNCDEERLLPHLLEGASEVVPDRS